jgi:hypothetical protein
MVSAIVAVTTDMVSSSQWWLDPTEAMPEDTGGIQSERWVVCRLRYLVPVSRRLPSIAAGGSGKTSCSSSFAFALVVGANIHGRSRTSSSRFRCSRSVSSVMASWEETSFSSFSRKGFANRTGFPQKDATE